MRRVQVGNGGWAVNAGASVIAARRGRTGLVGLVALILAAALAAPVAESRADDLPIMLGYQAQHDHDLRASLQRDPRQIWTGQVLARIEDNRVRPPIKLLRTEAAEVAFTVARDGKLIEARLQRLSGLEAVDKAALATVQRAQPFPPMPANLAEAQMSFVLPIRFR